MKGFEMILAKSFGSKFEARVLEIFHPLPHSIEQHWDEFFPKTTVLKDGRDNETDKIVPTDWLYWEVICMDAVANVECAALGGSEAFRATAEIYKYLEDTLGEFAVSVLSELAFQRLSASGAVGISSDQPITITISTPGDAL